MALPPWTVELLRRGLTDVAARARDGETIEKIRSRANDLVQDLPETAARGIESASRGIDKLVKSAGGSTESLRRWSEKFTAISMPCINASGTWIDARVTTPVDESVIAAGIEALHGSRVRLPESGERLTKKLSRAAGVDDEHAVIATNNFAAAIVALFSLSAERPFLVPRSEVFRLAGRPLPDLTDSSFAVVCEIGASDGFDAADLDGFDQATLIRSDHGVREIEFLENMPAGISTVAILRVGLVRRDVASDQKSGQAKDIVAFPTAVDLLRRGCEIVLIPGDGLIGGPESGLLIGNHSVIERIIKADAWPALAADDAKVAMLCKALKGVSGGPTETSPVFSLLATSVENLKGRAERMATRLTAGETQQTVQITADEAAVIAGGRWQIPSRQIRVRRPGVSGTSFAERLAARNPSLLVGHDSEGVVIDLRWVDPAHDNDIVTALLA